MMPQVGYFTIADVVYILIFLASLLPVLLQIAGWFLIAKRKGTTDERAKELVDDLNLATSLIMIPLYIFIAVWFYIIF